MKRLKRVLLSLVLTAILLSSIFQVTAFANEYDVGTNGEITTLISDIPEEAIHIQTEQQLRAIPENSTEYYVLDNDITLTEEWKPLVNLGGVFDGQGHTISNLYVNAINTANPYEVGFISVMSSQDIFLSIQDLEINIASQGINAVSEYPFTVAGGLIGYCESDVIIENCVVTGGNISANYQVGGLIGVQKQGDLKIENSYVRNNIFGTAINEGFNSFVGGLVGYIDDSRLTYAIINKCYATGNITSLGNENSWLGGLFGYSYYRNTSLSDNYRLSTQLITSEVKCNINEVGKPLTSDEMKEHESYENIDVITQNKSYILDFDTIWAIVPSINDGYPMLQSFSGPIAESGFASNYLYYTPYKQNSFVSYPGEYNNNNCGAVAICNIISYYKTFKGLNNLYDGDYITKEVHDEIFSIFSNDSRSFDAIKGAAIWYIESKGYTANFNRSAVPAMRWDDIRSYINNGLPVLFRNREHIMLIIGYKIVNGVNYLYVNNDYNGDFYGWIKFRDDNSAASVDIN